MPGQKLCGVDQQMEAQKQQGRLNLGVGVTFSNRKRSVHRTWAMTTAVKSKQQAEVDSGQVNGQTPIGHAGSNSNNGWNSGYGGWGGQHYGGGGGGNNKERVNAPSYDGLPETREKPGSGPRNYLRKLEAWENLTTTPDNE